MSVGLLGVVLLTAVSLDARERGAPTDAPAVEAAPVPGDRVSALELDARGLDEPTLRAAIELRLPEVDVYSRADGELLADRRAPYVYVEIRRGDARPEHAITMITSDGRVFRRVVPIEDDEPERAVASAVSSTIMAIETGSVAPDETGSTIPQAAEAPAEAPAQPPSPAPAPAPAPAPRRVAPPLQLGVEAHAGALLGPGPPRYGDVFLGWFGGLGLALRTPAGALALLELRAGGRAIEGARLVRVRALVGGGYAWRRDRLELALALALLVEPWLVRPGDALVLAGAPASAPRGFPPLLGAALRFSPGYMVMLKRGRALRVGPRLELAGGLVRGDGGPRVAGVGARDEGGELTPRFRLGGLELLTGLELVAWFDVPRRRRAGAASPEKKP